MNKKIKQDRFRLFIQCLAFAFQNGYISGWKGGKIYSGDNKQFCVPGLNCYSCPGAIGACPIGSLEAVLDSGTYHYSLYVIGFIGLVGIFCGRFICGWICPFGLVQDLMYKIPFVKKIKNLPGHKYLRYLRFVILALFVIILPMGVKNQGGSGSPWFCEWICPSGTLLGGIPLVLANSTLRAAIGPRFVWKVSLLVLILILAILSNRPFCKYICPLGALYGFFNPVSVYRLKVDQDKCITCGACQKACGMDIKVWEKPNSMDCIRCGKCMAACPKGAISSTLSDKINILKKDTQNTPVSARIQGKEASASVTVQAQGQEVLVSASADRKAASGTYKRGKYIGLGIGSLIVHLICFFIFAYLTLTFAVGGYGNDLFTFYGGFRTIMFFLPAWMLDIYMTYMLFRYSKDQAKMEQLGDWSGKNLRFFGVSLVVSLIYNAAFVMFYYPIDTFVISDVIDFFKRLLYSYVIWSFVTIPVFLLILISYRVLKPKKVKA